MIRFSRLMAALGATLLLSGTAAAQNFSVLVSPPRFEALVKPGETYRNVIEITNVSAEAGRYRLRTADWSLDADGSAIFSTELAPGSCRPWVGIEAPEIAIPGNGKRRYRFEVAVPADAQVGECRFAILLEGEPEAVKGSVPVPVAGRIGIIVYATIGDAAPQLEIAGHEVREVRGQKVPVLQIRNAGNAHGRLEGLVDGTDASGKRYSFLPSNLPILAGETRAVVLTPEADNPDAAPPALTFPLRLSGRLESGAQRLDVALTLQQ